MHTFVALYDSKANDRSVENLEGIETLIQAAQA